jgi:hypothetical protein
VNQSEDSKQVDTLHFYILVAKLWQTPKQTRIINILALGKQAETISVIFSSSLACLKINITSKCYHIAKSNKTISLLLIFTQKY